MLFGVCHYLNTPPNTFTPGIEFVISPGMSTRSIGKSLYTTGLIRSEWFFYILNVLNTESGTLKAGTYRFEVPLSTTGLLAKLKVGDFTANLQRITFPEGITVRMMADIIAANNFPDFNKTTFLDLASQQEGLLFPDTYFVPKTFTAEDWYELLATTHITVLTELRNQYTSTLTDYEIVTLASILEREANTPESKRMVSGILQNRLAIDMALQADATMEYVLDKPLGELVPSDLEIESPYNTYLNPGLPPTPIGNPGRTALQAAFNPTPSSYFFYITGNDGVFYYAEDFDQHRLNIERHLR
jgi:UPF0755 protein